MRTNTIWFVFGPILLSLYIDITNSTARVWACSVSESLNRIETRACVLTKREQLGEQRPSHT